MAATRVIVDTGPLVAYWNQSDLNHEWAVRQWASLIDPVWTCEAVISETAFLLNDDGLKTEHLWIALQRGIVRVDFHFEAQKPDLLRLLRKYEDQPMSVADACLVRLSELTGQSAIFTMDTHFRVYRRHGRGIIPLIAPFSA